MPYQLVRVTGTRLMYHDEDGNPAAGYKVWTLRAGTLDTQVITYLDKDGLVPNTNPIVLDLRGEANVWSLEAIKLQLCEPTTTVPGDGLIQEDDWLGEPDLNVIVSVDATPVTQNNHYIGSVTPAYTQIPASIVLFPDVDNLDTFQTQAGQTAPTRYVPIGVAGMNDATFVGPYIGSTPGSTFTVQIDGTSFQGTGLNDLTWIGTAASGHVYTVKISTAAAPADSFQWRKDGGVWSSEIAISVPPANQVLDVDVSIKFGASTGHTLADLWNIVDTFQWQKDSGFTTGVAILGNNTEQNLLEGVSIKFAEKTGHTLNDLWTVVVMTPADFNFCSLGAKLIKKNVAGSLVALTGRDTVLDTHGDMVAGYPAHLDWASDQNVYILLNPSLPVLSSLPRKIWRKEIITNYSVTAGDASNEISYIGPGGHTVTLLPAGEFSGDLVDIVNASLGALTVQVTAGHGDTIVTPEFPGGTTSFILSPGVRTAARVVSNGVNYHLPLDASVISSRTVFTASGTVTVPYGLPRLFAMLQGAGGGGGGGGGLGGGGGGGGAMITVIVTDPTPGTLTVTVGTGGAGGAGVSGTPGADGLDSYIVSSGAVTYARAKGGKGGIGSAGGSAGGLGGNYYVQNQVKVIGLSCRNSRMNVYVAPTIEQGPPVSITTGTGTLSSDMDGGVGSLAGGAGGVSGTLAQSNQLYGAGGSGGGQNQFGAVGQAGLVVVWW